MFRFTVLRLILGVAFLTALVSWVAAQDGPELPPAQPPDPQTAAVQSTNTDLPEGVEALARGPLHEAFAEPLTARPDATMVISRKPPDPIEEVPPEVKPDADAEWIPGYWAWDDERNDFIWISGAWRVPPTDQRWVPGYWAEVSGGYQWVPGFWTSADVEQVNYLPEPPATLEQGPSSPSPGNDYFWVPGNWTYQEVDYAWTPGYWAHVQPNWVWVPAHYCWSPTGYVYVGGYWDYPLVRRGWLFTPVYFSSPIYAQPDFFYTPTVVVNTPLLAVNLFVRPSCNWYYFGDYYDTRYASHYVPWFQYGRRAYDPIYTYQRWYHGRRNPNWYRDIQNQFAVRQRDPSARPPRVFNVNNTTINNTNIVNQNNLAVRLNQFTSQEGVRERVQRLPSSERQQFARTARELRQLQDQRQRLELSGISDRGRRGAQERVTLRLPTMEDAGVQQRLRGRGRGDLGRTDVPNRPSGSPRDLSERAQQQARDAARSLREREAARGSRGDAIGDLDVERGQIRRQQADRIRREAQQRAEIDRARVNRQFDRGQDDLREQAAEQSRRRRQLEQPDDAQRRLREFQRSQLNDENQRARRSTAEQQRREQIGSSENLQRARAMAQQQQQQERVQQMQQERMREMRANQDAQRARSMQLQQQQQRRQQVEQMRASQESQRARAMQQQQQQQRMQQMRANQDAQRAREAAQRVQQQRQQQQQQERRRQEVRRPVQPPAFQQRVDAVRDAMRQPGGGGGQFGRPQGQPRPEGRGGGRRGKPEPR